MNIVKNYNVLAVALNIISNTDKIVKGSHNRRVRQAIERTNKREAKVSELPYYVKFKYTWAQVLERAGVGDGVRSVESYKDRFRAYLQQGLDVIWVNKDIRQKMMDCGIEASKNAKQMYSESAIQKVKHYNNKIKSR